MGVCIVGWGHSKFGRTPEVDLESLIVGVAREALEHASVPVAAVDGVWLGNLNGGLVAQHFPSSLAQHAHKDLRWKPAVRLENACASGSAAIYAACDAIEAGRARIALVVGAEKMTGVSGAEVTRVLGNCSYLAEPQPDDKGFPGLFAYLTRAYFARHGDHAATLAKIAAKNHANGVRNPWAQMRRDLGFEYCNTVSEKNPIVAAPLRVTDCSLVSDGAAALILVDEALAADFPRAVRFRARAQVSDYLPLARRNVLDFEGPRRAWAQALAAAGCTVNDLSLAEVHDCFTTAELLCYEAMGLAEAGRGHELLAEGVVYPGGRLPVNASGGLKAKGHPIGATGVSMHALAAMQLLGEAGDMQVPGAELAGVFNMGGAAVANYVSILEPCQ